MATAMRLPRLAMAEEVGQDQVYLLRWGHRQLAEKGQIRVHIAELGLEVDVVGLLAAEVCLCLRLFHRG